MKVSPECFIQLCQREKYCTRKRERYIIQVQSERTGKGILVKSRQKGQRKVHY